MMLKNKRILVTGGTRGLGRALVFRFAAEGASVAACARSADALNRLELELRLRGARALALQCDISDAEQVQLFAKNVLEEFQGIDVIVNNASLLGPRIEIVEITHPTWERVIDVNVNGLFYTTRAFLPSMIDQKSGSIINVTSSVGKIGKARWGAYAVSKFALEGFTQTLADEVRSSHVRVNSVNPGAIATEMRRAAYPNEDQGNLKSPEEITDVFVYLASGASLGITAHSFDAQHFKSHSKETV